MINEIYLAVCGEGREIGLPATFVRTSGCNLRCPGWPCDTPYTSVDPQGALWSPEAIAERVAEIGCPRVFLTGGEPLLWRRQLPGLLRMLRAKGHQILLQSNGTLYDDELFALFSQVSVDCKTPSSGEKSDLDVIRRVIDRAPDPQVKFVIRDEVDLAFAVQTLNGLEAALSSSAIERCSFVAQPMDAVGHDDAASLLARLDWLQRRVQDGRHWRFRVLPQLHVLVHGALTRGV